MIGEPTSEELTELAVLLFSCQKRFIIEDVQGEQYTFLFANLATNGKEMILKIKVDH